MANTAVCAYPHCERPARKKGYCDGHYQQSCKGLELKPLAARTRMQGLACSAECCNLPAVKGGYCGGHYQQVRAGRALTPLKDMGRGVRVGCVFPECPHPHEARGYCGGHYQQIRSGRTSSDMTPLQLIREGCAYPKCPNPHDSNGYCSSHSKQFRTGEGLRRLIGPSRAVAGEGCSMIEVFSSEDAPDGAATKFMLVDAEDASRFEGLRLFLSSGYARVARHAETAYGSLAHRIILSLSPTDPDVDHINGNRLDCRRSNLRLATHYQNMQNKGVRRDSQTGVRGVGYDPRKGLYRAVVTFNGKKHSGGRHQTLEAAEKAASELRFRLMEYTNEERRRGG